MNASRTIVRGAALLGFGAIPVLADAVNNFNHSVPGVTTFTMRNLNQGARDGTDGDSDFFFNSPPRYPANQDHLTQNWWYVRQTVQDLVDGDWVDNGADSREYSLGELDVPQHVAGNRTRDYFLTTGERRVTLGYDALRPAGSPAGVGEQPIDISYRLQPSGIVSYSFNIGRPAGLGPTRRMLTDFFWLVDIDAHGTAANDRVLAGKGNNSITALFDDNAIYTASIFVSARGFANARHFKARVDSRANLLGIMTNNLVTDLDPGLTDQAAGAAGDWAILYQWSFRRGGAARDDDEDYALVADNYAVDFESDSDFCLGDLDHSQQVDLNDLVVVLANFGRQGDVMPNEGDLDFDGDVDLDDLSRMLARFGMSC